MGTNRFGAWKFLLPGGEAEEPKPAMRTAPPSKPAMADRKTGNEYRPFKSLQEFTAQEGRVAMAPGRPSPRDQDDKPNQKLYGIEDLPFDGSSIGTAYKRKESGLQRVGKQAEPQTMPASFFIGWDADKFRRARPAQVPARISATMPGRLAQGFEPVQGRLPAGLGGLVKRHTSGALVTPKSGRGSAPGADFPARAAKTGGILRPSR